MQDNNGLDYNSATKPIEFWELMAQSIDKIDTMMPQAVALGIKTISITKAKAKKEMAWREDLVGDVANGIIASGAVVTLIDHTCGSACSAALSEPVPLATLDLRVDYLRAAPKGLTIIAEAECYRLTKNIAFVRAIAKTGENQDDIVAIAQATFMLTPEKSFKAKEK